MTYATPDTGQTDRRAGRPRDPRVQRAILDAARELLAERGVGGLTVEAVAARAGVGKPTVYRRYRSSTELALAVLIEMVKETPPADLGDTRKELLAFVTGAINVIHSTLMGPIVQGLVPELAANPELAVAFRERVLSARASAVRQLVEQAAARGDLPANTDPELVRELLLSPIYFRLLLTGEPLDRKLATRIVDTTLAALAAPRNLKENP